MYEWTARIGEPTDLVRSDEGGLAESAKLYVVNAEDGAVTFSMDPDTFSAASKERDITFTFTAKDTPIKAGKVWVEVPGTWSKPVITDDEAGELTGPEDDNISVTTRRGKYRITISKVDLAINRST